MLFRSIHAPAKGATSSTCFSGCPAEIFQSTLPRRERQMIVGQSAIQYAISIHAPAKGATDKHVKDKHMTGISIHAPAKGATYTAVIFGFGCNISIHAPAKGATRLSPSRFTITKFQSTLPRRERRKTVS